MVIINHFFEKYIKIIAGALIFLLLAWPVTTLGTCIFSCNTVLKSNEDMLEHIIDNTENWEKYVDDISEQNIKSDIDNCKLLATFLTEFNSDVNNEDILNSYFDALGTNEFYILDSNREIIYQYKHSDKIDFTDIYYDQLFDFSVDNSEGDLADCCNFIAAKNEDNVVFNAVKGGDVIVVVESYQTSIENYKNDIYKWKTILNNLKTADKSVVSVVDADNREIIYSEDEQFIGITLDDFNFECPMMGIGGNSYLAKARLTSDSKYYLLVTTPLTSVFKECLYNSNEEGILVVFGCIILVAYIVFLREDVLDSRSEFEFLGKYYLRTQIKRFVAFCSVILIQIIIILIGLIDLNFITRNTTQLHNEAEECTQLYEQYFFDRDDVADAEDSMYFKYCKMLYAFIDNHSEYGDKKGLREINNLNIGYLFGLDSVTYFDAYGKTIITSSPLDNLCILDDKDSSLYELRKVLIGKETMRIEPDSDIIPDDCTIYAISNRDDNDYADGIFAVTLNNNKNLNTSLLNDDQEDDTIETLLELRYIDDNETLIIVDKEGVILLHPENSLVGSTIEEIGYTEDILSGNEAAIENVNGKEYCVGVATTSSENYYIIITEPITWITLKIIYRIVVFIILFILLVLFMIYDGLGSKYHFESRSAKVKDADDWQNTKITWKDLNASKKINITLKYCIYIFAIFIIYVYFVTDNGFADVVGFSYIVEGNWSKSLNFFAIWGNVCLVCVIYSAIQWTCKLIDLCVEVIGEENTTAFLVLASMMKYSGAILAFSMCAKNFGFDTKTILASIGIVGFGLTFGAQDMIKDLIAGIFILFEGNYKVGDMLLINGSWYWVDSIGVRTTKVSAWGSVMVINNSKMTDVINIQNASTCVDCDVTIGNEYDITDVITILEANLPRLKENFPSDVSTPAYKGIQHLHACGPTIRIRIYCPPLKQGWVGRALRAEVKRIFDEYNIKIIPDDSLIVNTEIAKKTSGDEIIANAQLVKESAQKIRVSKECK